MDTLAQTGAQHLTVDPFWPVVVIAALVLGAWLALQGAFRLGHDRRPKRVARFSPWLRTAVLALLALCLLRPSGVLRRVLHESGQVLVLVDRSASMGIADEPGGRTRAASLARSFQNARNAYAELRAAYEVHEYEFADQLQAVDDFSFASDGGRTALGDSLSEAVRGRLPSRLSAVIVATDGASNTGPPPEDVAQAYRKLGIPLHVVACGQERVGSDAKDVVLQNVEAPKVVFVRNVAVVSAKVALLNVPRTRVTVRLLVDQQEVDRATVATRAEQDVSTVHFRYIPKTPGYRKITVEARPIPDERTDGNNRASAYLNVLSGKLTVLYLEGTLRWEFKFLKRALEEAPQVDLTARVVLAPAERGRSSALKSDEAWDRFDVVILGDIPRDRFTASQLEALVTAVGDGVGLVTLAGYDTYGASYFATPLAKLFPFYLSPGALQREDTYAVHPAAGAEDHSIVQLTKHQDNARVWAQMPPVVGGVRAAKLKPAATEILVDEAGEPVLVVQPYGKGRVASLLIDTTWRWALGHEQAKTAHRRFWRQLLLWASGQDSLRRKSLWVELPQSRYLAGEPVSPVVHLEDADGKPIPNAKLVVTVAPSNGGQPEALRLYRTGDNWESLYVPPGEGDYLIEARAYDGDPGSPEAELLGQTTARFLVEQTNLELADPLAHIGTLSQLAEMTGGSFRRPDGLAELFEKLTEEHEHVELTQVRRRDLWNRPELLILIVGLLAADWVIRKRSGLV